MGLADLHIHTTYSWDGTCTVSAVLKRAKLAGLDVIAVTDHNEIAGALEARQLAPRYGLELIPGVEISTAEGHLLALYVDRVVPAGLGLIETILAVGLLGGLCVAPHPAARRASCLSLQSIRAALDDPAAAGILVGIEAFNAGPLSGPSNAVAPGFAKQLGIAQVASSDAHVDWAVGIAATQFEGNSADDLRQALITGATRPQVRQDVHPAQLARSWTVRRMLRALGWVAFNPHPEAPLVLARGMT